MSTAPGAEVNIAVRFVLGKPIAGIDADVEADRPEAPAEQPPEWLDDARTSDIDEGEFLVPQRRRDKAPARIVQEGPLGSLEEESARTVDIEHCRHSGGRQRPELARRGIRLRF